MSTTSSPMPARRYVPDLSRPHFFAVVSLFWVYVTVSNVLYAWGMRTTFAHVTSEPLFASWDARVIQHLLLLPCLWGAYALSLRIQWRPLWAALPLQVILALTFAALAYPAMLLAEFTVGAHDLHQEMLQHPQPMHDPLVLSLWMSSLVSFLPTYGFGLALITGIGLYTRFRRSELRRAALEREWSTARLAALRMQLSPHTLFNLLHTIRGYIEWDPKGAQAMVVQLADLLRRLLSAGERDFSPLADELQFARLYLELQQRRFVDRLTVLLPLATEISEVWVPSLILQPLIENAVVHGLAGHTGPVVVRVGVRRGEGSLVLTVANTIAGEPHLGGAGIGLRNVRERLEVQFEGRARLTCEIRDQEWVSEISLPEVHESPAPIALRAASELAPV
ncbi:MAG TPA: histidine kinase [Steroidobacteraceae bacterium]|nr:histidine kinase [Steroidobacteraceae bacterium]